MRTTNMCLTADRSDWFFQRLKSLTHLYAVDAQKNTPQMTSEESVSQAVLLAVAEAKGVDVTALESPLQEAIDVDALNSLLQRGTKTVTFDYSGFEVTVDRDAHVTLRPLVK